MVSQRPAKASVGVSRLVGSSPTPSAERVDATCPVKPCDQVFIDLSQFEISELQTWVQRAEAMGLIHLPVRLTLGQLKALGIYPERPMTFYGHPLQVDLEVALGR
jgi:hypothetical protein